MGLITAEWLREKVNMTTEKKKAITLDRDKQEQIAQE